MLMKETINELNFGLHFFQDKMFTERKNLGISSTFGSMDYFQELSEIYNQINLCLRRE